MISNRDDYRFFLECDRIALRRKKRNPKLFGDHIWKYQIALRRVEFCLNCLKKYNPLRIVALWRFKTLSSRCGFSIAPNTVGPGLSIAHKGTIIINSNARVGSNCRIQTGVTIGATNGSEAAPDIGDNVFLGDGCKIIGNITVANDVQIGANAVVVKDILEPATTWGGVPARKISNHSSEKNIVRATTIVSRYNNNN